MNDQRIAIICDSGCDVPEDFILKHDVRVVPLTLNYSEGSYLSGVDITTDEVIRRFAEEIPTTSLPSPALIREVFEKAQADGYEKAVFVGISRNLSATLQTAEMIANMLDDFPVITIDSKNISMGAGMSVMSACEMIEEGIVFEDLERRLSNLAEVTSLYFVTKTLEYLHRGGRISDAVYKVGSVLNIKPIITCDHQGKYITTKKSRGIDKAMRYETSMIRSKMEDFEHVRVGILTSTDKDFQTMKELTESKMDNIEHLFRAHISPALVVHTGPDIIGIGAQPDWRYLS